MSGHRIPKFNELLSVAVALIVLTAITIAVRALHLPKELAITAAMGIAAIKSALVALFFMGLFWDKKLNTVVFLTSLVFLALMIGITLSDTLFREVFIPSF